MKLKGQAFFAGPEFREYLLETLRQTTDSGCPFPDEQESRRVEDDQEFRLTAADIPQFMNDGRVEME